MENIFSEQINQLLRISGVYNIEELLKSEIEGYEKILSFQTEDIDEFENYINSTKFYSDEVNSNGYISSRIWYSSSANILDFGGETIEEMKQFISMAIENDKKILEEVFAY